MRKKILLCMSKIALVTILVLTSSFTIINVESQFEYYPDVTINPNSPKNSDNINLTVSITFSSQPPYVEEFGLLTKVGNIYSVNLTVYVPFPGDIRLPVFHTDSDTYNLGKLDEGEYEVEVYVQHIHYTEWMYYLGTRKNFNVTFDAGIIVPDDYLTIQEAINAASDGDTVFVRNGTYIENVVVNKSLSLLGEDKENTIVDGNGVGTVIQVDSDNVTISGLQVRGSSMEWGDYGIILKDSSNCVISGNIVKAVYAISVEKGSRNHITDNEFVGDDGSCIFQGLQLVNSTSNVVSHNNLSVNCHTALTLYNSSNNMVSFNYISGHFVPFPFTMEKSSNNSIVGNTMRQPAPLFGGHIYFNESKGNAFYHNSFIADDGPNTLSVDELSTNNTWDNGYEGNYWSNYEERYPNSSYDQFGIWDTPYVIDENNQDNYPLRNPYWSPTDTNHDLKVDIFDIVLAAACYCLDWQDNYVHVDIMEPYGIVDIFDIVAIASHYGEEYTP